MWDPSKSIKEQLKLIGQKSVVSPAVVSVDGVISNSSVPLEAQAEWITFVGKLQFESDKWTKQIRMREEAKKWVYY